MRVYGQTCWTRLNVTYKKSAAGSFALDALLDDRIVHLVVSFATLRASLEPVMMVPPASTSASTTPALIVVVLTRTIYRNN